MIYIVNDFILELSFIYYVSNNLIKYILKTLLGIIFRHM